MAGCFLRDKHIRYFSDILAGLPHLYQPQECNRITLAYFAVSALDILRALDQVAAADVIEWVYSLQFVSADGENAGKCGFRGSNTIAGAAVFAYDSGNLALTYAALCILRILGDDFSRVSRLQITRAMRCLQQPDGSFSPVQAGAEADMRFVFCAAAISSMLQDWRGMDVHLACQFILSSQSYDAGFGLSPGLESHGGATYCAIAALKLMGKLETDTKESVISWLTKRQAENGGYQGRVNKDADSCYAFWVGGCLQMLDAFNLCSQEELRQFLLTCQEEEGGFSKYPDEQTDVLHSYFGLCGMSLVKEPGLEGICYELGMSVRAANLKRT